ncbi:MAG TPA: serine hydrolase domain-containing protein [Enteractinococcus sp.]
MMPQQMTLEKLQADLDKISRRRRSMPPPQVLIETPDTHFEYGGQHTPFHAASVGKVMTAVVIAALVEQDRFEFNTPIGQLLPASDIEGLPTADGVTASTDVTVHHLLSHTSGFPDFFEPPRGMKTATSAKTAFTDPDRRWTPTDLLNEVRKLRALGRPGETFHYGDTGYVLLGRIAEETTDTVFDELVRQYVFEPSGMMQSSIPFSTARTPADLQGLDITPFWINGTELSRALAMSLDWAGGGIVATPADFVRFQRALHQGKLVSPQYVDFMARPRNRLRPGIYYGSGMVTLRFHEFLPSFLPFLRGLPEPVGGIGFLATHMFYYPEQDAHVILNFHTNRALSTSARVHIRIAQLLASE